MEKLKGILIIIGCAAVVVSCANVQDRPYYLAATDLKCDGVITSGEFPVLDPTQTYSVCEDRDGHLYFPAGVLANTTVTSGVGLVSGMVQQASQVGAMLGGF